MAALPSTNYPSVQQSYFWRLHVTSTTRDRMPVILSPESFAAWLDLSTPAMALLDMLRPGPVESLALHPVDARVGNVRNDDAGLVEPLAGLLPA